MKTAFPLVSHPNLRLVALAIAALGLVANLQAQPAIKTLAGGPKTFNNNSYGYRDGSTLTNAQFNGPSALALNTVGTLLYVADRTNNVIRQITMPANAAGSQTTTFTNNGWPTNKVIYRPVDVAVDGANNVYVLNWAGGTNGFITKFNQYANFLGYLATNLNNPTAFTFDGSTNLYVTLHTNAFQGTIGLPNSVMRILSTDSSVTNWAIIDPTNSGIKLNGIVVLDSGMIALADGNTNGGIRLLDPVTGTNWILTGCHGPGDTIGTAAFAQFKSIEKISKAGGGILVVADRGNHRVKIVDPYGTVTDLFGVASNLWISPKLGWLDGPGIPFPSADQSRAEAREPVAVLVDNAGNVYDTEMYYQLIRQATGTGLTGPGGVNSGTGSSSTNSTSGGTTGATSVTTPSILPNTGYFPMGQTITVNSTYPDVFYTTDGTVPTTNSTRVPVSGNIGHIIWNNSVSDLTFLSVAAFNGTNSSLVTNGIPATTNSIGIPTGRAPNILAGVGSTIILPVVANLRTNDQIKSFEFRVEIAPNDPATPPLPFDIGALSISSNDFVSVTTDAQNGQTAYYTIQPYTITNSAAGITTNGLIVSAIGTNSNVSFTHYGVVAMLTVNIPNNALPGETYNIKVLDPSATSDAKQTAVSLYPTPDTTILVTNVAYTVGDVAPGNWYNAGDFGDGNLANNDVNTIFYASVGLRVPDAYSDVFDAMDAFPQDAPGFVGGDGQIRFLDWQVISDRALRLDVTNFVRAWSANGLRTNNLTTLITPAVSALASPATPPGQVWYKQAKVGATYATNGPAGSTVTVPVYLRVITGASISGMEFRAIVTPNSDTTPALTQTLQFIPAAGVATPISQSSIVGEDSEIGCGWSLGTLKATALSSNIVGFLQITLPATATAGESYTVHFANADGSPDGSTQYDFESCSALINVGNAPAATPDGISDEWKIRFFGSVNSPLADANADPDGDGSPNWQEYLNGTDPTVADSYLHLIPGAVQTNNAQKFIPFQWLSAPGKIYVVERATSLGATNWNAVSTLAGDGYQHAYNETNLTGTAVFYRVRVTAP